MFSSLWRLDTLERVVATFLQTFLAVWIIDGASVDLSTDMLSRAALAGLAAVLSFVKALIAQAAGDADSASLAPIAVERITQP